MINSKRFGGVATAVLVAGGILFAATAKAQEIPEAHLQAARSAITALGVTNQFDGILPNLAEGLKAQLIQAYPNFQNEIFSTVDTKALELAGRRGDLEREAALVYAKAFTPEELNAIAAFYTSDAGKKLLTDGPIVTRELVRAAEIWASGIRRDLENSTNQAMLAIAGASAPADAAAGAAQAPAAPAEAPAPKP